MDEWITAHSSAEAAEPTPTARRVTERQRDAAKKAVKKATKSSIGANPRRRYGSAPSRTLARR